MRYRTPIIYRILKWVLNVLCPPAKKETAVHLVASFDGGLIHIDTSSSIEYHLLFRGCHEPEVVNLIKQIVKPGDRCLDIGANIGAHTLLMARMAGLTGHVVALEPHPEICRRLRQNIALNRLTNVEVINAALAEKDGAIDLYGFVPGAFEQGISSLLPDDQAKAKISVRAIRGATLLREHRIASCDFLKIDIEGAESLALHELGELINAQRPVILFEYRKQHWQRFGAELDPVLRWLRAAGYDLYYIHRNVTRPLAGNAPPASCELFCVPSTGVGNGS
jgi:FkbM family methyltransferase